MTLGRGSSARYLALVALALLGGAVLLRGSGMPERGLEASAPVDRVGTAPLQRSSGVAEQRTAAPPAAAATGAHPASGPVAVDAGGTGSAIHLAVATTTTSDTAVVPRDETERLATFAAGRPDRRSLALIAGIERELQSEAPPEVHELLLAWRRGATRQELLERTRRDLPPSFALRALVVRWINEVAPDPDRPATAPAASRLAQQRGRWLTPIRPLAAP